MFWLIDDNLLPSILSSDIRPAVIKSTDHLAISLKIKPCSKRGLGFWKLNNSYLNDVEYISMISNLVDSLETENINDYQQKWDLCKCKIKELSVIYAKSKARKKTK